MKRHLILIGIVITFLCIVLVLGAIYCLPSITPDTPDTPDTSSSSGIGSSTSSTASTGATAATTPPPATVPQASAPAIAEHESVGSHYTRAELDEMDNSRQSIWPGTDNEGKRPLLITGLQREYNTHTAYFIGKDNSSSYLTFACDDESFTKNTAGEYIPNTAVVLDILKNHQVKATFFVTGKFCYNHPEVVKRIIDEGHILGNYGWNSIELPGLSTQEIVAQITTLHDYVLSQFGYTMKYFRPYNGAYSDRVFATANSLGYTSVIYSIAYPDRTATVQYSDTQALEKLVAQFHKGAIFRLHPVSPTTVNILSDLIGILRDSFYQVSPFKP